MQDAQRLLPVLGLMLWMVPTLWPSGEEAGRVGMSDAILYVFGVWCMLIGLSAWLWRGLHGGAEDAPSDMKRDVMRDSARDP